MLKKSFYLLVSGIWGRLESWVSSNSKTDCVFLISSLFIATKRMLQIIKREAIIAVNFVKKVIDASVDYIKQLNSSVEIIHYFSDGCSKQYKCWKNFLNLSLHKTGYQIDAKWHFFATRHGKNSCDGIGGSIKGTVRRASLQRPYSDQILDLDAMHTFCLDKIKTVKFVLFSKTDKEA